MGRRYASYRSAIEAFVAGIAREEDYAPRTLRFYRDEAMAAFHLLDKHVRPDLLPHDVTRKDLLNLLRWMRDNGYAVETTKGYVSALRRCCEYFGNTEPRTLKIRWPQDMRPNVDWLTMEQAQALLNIPKTVPQEIIIHLELCLGFRRVEIARLQADHIDRKKKIILVTGKGSGGGKLRYVPFHADTSRVLARYDSYRESLIAVAQAKQWNTRIPTEYIIWGQGSRLKPYSDKRLTAIDKHVKAVAEAVGFDFSNHTLRRTFGRLLWKSGGDVVAIAKILGHESTDMTLRYIGADMDDMKETMQNFKLKMEVNA